MENIKYSEWIIKSKENKMEIIRGILDNWQSNGIELRSDEKWFYEALEAGYVEGVDGFIEETMEVLAIMGNIIVNKERDLKIAKLISKITNDEFKIYSLCQKKLDEKHKTQQILSDEEFNDIIKCVAREIGVSENGVLKIWQKVDGAKLGVEIR